MGTISSHFTVGLQSKGTDLEISMAHLCFHESIKRNMGKPSENANQPSSFAVSTKSICFNWSALVTSSEESRLYIYWVL